MAKRKNKKKNFKYILFLIFIISATFIYFNFKKNSFLNEINYEYSGTINYYDIYGIHMNFNGEFELDDNLSNPKLVLANSSYEKEIKWNLENEDNNYSFKTSDYINDGINLENLKLGTYYLLIKAKSNDSDIYFPLINTTEYKNLEYYTLTKNNSNKKIDITWDKYKDNELLTFNIKNTTLPDDVYDITIDPGHDGNDAGVIVCSDGSAPDISGKCMTGDTYKESDINFYQAEELKKELEKLGYKVKLTRNSTTDTIPTYGKMGSGTTANTTKSKFNIAIHHNSSNVPGGMSSIYGLEVYVAGNSKFDLAKSFVKNITEKANVSVSTKKEFKVQDGIYQRFSDDDITPYYYMIREVGGIATHAYVDGSNTKYDENPYYNSNNTAEGYLLELGYIDNVKELKNILNNKDKYAKGIALGLDKYLKNTSD